MMVAGRVNFGLQTAANDKFMSEEINMKIDLEKKIWIAEVPDLPGVLVWTREDAIAKVEALALRVLHG